MPQQYKIDKVAEIESRVEANAGVFVVNYNGLTVKQAEELRHQLREAGAEMKVYKNNLVRIALKNQDQPEIDDILVGPVAYVFYENEPVEAAKALKEFAKKSKGVLEIKGGIPPRISFSARSPASSTASPATSLFASMAFPAVLLVRSSRSPSRRLPSSNPRRPTPQPRCIRTLHSHDLPAVR